MIQTEAKALKTPSKALNEAAASMAPLPALSSARKRPVNTLNGISEFERRVISRLQLPAKLEQIFQPYRFKTLYGGRGSAKSRSIGGILIVLAALAERRILCTREWQSSMKDSVMALLKYQIKELDLKHRFRFGQSYIEGKNGSEFIFEGLRVNPDKIKSMEGVDYCWIEEAQRVSEASWVYLIPTIRKPGSEFFISFNPEDEDDPTYKRFVKSPPPNALTVKLNWRDNPWFPGVLDEERRYCLESDLDAYQWIWEGNTRKISDAVIFKGKFSVETFETPTNAKFLLGADWGFGADPTTLVRGFEKDGYLYIDQECYAFSLDLDQIAPTWRKAIPGCDKLNIYADNSQPQTINHVKGFGFKIGPAKKWSGSVEDGIKFMRGYKGIIVHERCYYTGQEMRLYSYKTDRVTDKVLPIVNDKHNHCIDAIRYMLDKRIKRKKGVI